MDIRKTYHLPFSPARVYEAWLSPETVVPPVTRVEVLPEAGGHIRLFVDGADFVSTMMGRIEELRPAELLLYSWEWDNDGHRTLVRVELKPEGGGTRIEILHSGFEDQQSLENHDLGWDQYVAGVGRILAGHGAGS